MPPDRYRAGLAILAARYTIVHDYQPAAPDGPLPYLAGDDEARAGALDAALRDERVEAIFCARGGYGSSRLLGRLDGEALRRRRPLLVGFSDVTALHCWAARLGVPSVHGPVVSQLARLPEEDRAALFALLEGEAPALSGLECLVPGTASGPLLGGNLTLLAHLCGTPQQPDLHGRLLLLEEVGEAPYRIDRLLTQLELAGVLDGVAGVVVGELTGCDAAAERHLPAHDARAVVACRLGALGVPTVLGAPVGHGARNVALPLGVPAHLDASAGALRFEPR